MFVNVPLAIIAVIGAALLLQRQSKAAAPTKLDVPGNIIIVLGMV